MQLLIRQRAVIACLPMNEWTKVSRKTVAACRQVWTTCTWLTCYQISWESHRLMCSQKFCPCLGIGHGILRWYSSVIILAARIYAKPQTSSDDTPVICADHVTQTEVWDMQVCAEILLGHSSGPELSHSNVWPDVRWSICWGRCGRMTKACSHQQKTELSVLFIILCTQFLRFLGIWVFPVWFLLGIKYMFPKSLGGILMKTKTTCIFSRTLPPKKYSTPDGVLMEGWLEQLKHQLSWRLQISKRNTAVHVCWKSFQPDQSKHICSHTCI